MNIILMPYSYMVALPAHPPRDCLWSSCSWKPSWYSLLVLVGTEQGSLSWTFLFSYWQGIDVVSFLSMHENLARYKQS